MNLVKQNEEGTYCPYIQSECKQSECNFWVLHSENLYSRPDEYKGNCGLVLKMIKTLNENN